MSEVSLSLRHRVINAVMRTVHFGRVPVLDLRPSDADPRPSDADPRPSDADRRPRPAEKDSAPPRPRLIIASHRNGAIDGQQVLAAFPHVQFLVSIQLLRHWFLRLFIAGIPVVRPKDVDRYDLDPTSVASPLEAGCAHLRRGGDLGIFPEASSEWDHRPQPYKSGAARIACTLLAEGIAVEVIPVGLFYSNPDRFRSRAEVVRGPAVQIPGRDGRDQKSWQAEVASALGSALDEVSVNCPDEATFARVQTQALARARRTPGRTASFARAFLELQREAATGDGESTESDAPDHPDAPEHPGARTTAGPPVTAVRWIGFALLWLFAPVLLAGAAVGSRADGRNTVTFFRILGGFAAAMVWIPALIVGAVLWPAIIGSGLLSGLLGWLLLGVRRIRL